MTDTFERELVEAFGAELVDDEHVIELLDELGIVGDVRSQMLAELDRARAILEHAKSSRGIRNRAAFAIASWRARHDPHVVARLEPERELVEQPPTLAALEHLWSLEPTPVTAALERMMTAAIERHGGARALLEGAGMRVLDPQAELDLEP